MSWAYVGRDDGIRLYTACWNAGAPMPILSGQRILELGCCEEDWLHMAHDIWPDTHFVGVDTRAPDDIDAGGWVERKRANALNPDLFEPESMDGIVSLSAFEHFGLGHYGDPLDPDGDTQIIANCWRWLKPGGWLYFDVPYDPRKYWLKGTEYRAYNDEALLDRLWAAPLVGTCAAHWHFTGYCGSRTPETLIDKPTTQSDDGLRYYVAFCWQKDGHTVSHAH